jgi:hypothetical protein
VVAKQNAARPLGSGVSNQRCSSNQLSYTPVVVGVVGLEPTAYRISTTAHMRKVEASCNDDSVKSS